jgi:RNA polymerase sigma-70 factor (ECF subfamily)
MNVVGLGRAMNTEGEGKEISEGPSAGRAEVSKRTAARLVKENAVVVGRVAMALLGDADQVGRVLEQVARESASRSAPDGVRPLAWLLGLVRTVSAAHLSKLPLRTRSGGAPDAAPRTERMGAARLAAPARAALAALKPTEREAVILSIVGGLEAADVAVACNVDVGTAKTRIARGLAQLLEGAPEGDEGGAR